MKVLYVATISSTVNAFLIPHIQTLVAAGYQVDIACRIARPIDESLVELGCRVFDIPFERSPLSREGIQAYKDLDLLIGGGDYDIIHTHTPVASAITRWVCRKYPQVKVIYTAHGYHFFQGAPFFSNLLYFSLEYLLAKWTDLTITINSEDYEQAKRYFESDRHRVVHVNGVGVDTELFQSTSPEEKLRLKRLLDIHPQSFLMTYVGELSYRKNQAFLLQVIESLIPDEDVLLLLVGEGPEREELMKLTENMGLTSFVRFLGRREDIPRLFAASDLGVSASRQEGLAVNVMEAMASSLAVVVTDVRGNRDLIQDGENGYIIPEGDVEQFAVRVRGLIHDRDRLLAMGSRSRELMESFNIEHINDDILRLYQSVAIPQNDKLVSLEK